MAEKDDQDERDRCGRAERSAKSNGDRSDDSVDYEDFAETESAEYLDDEGLHAEVASEERKQIESGFKSTEAEGDLKHKRQKKWQHRDGDTEDARTIDGERVSLE